MEKKETHQALYRKYRPRVFGDVYGQDAITSVLKYEVANDKLTHAYLFCGSRGTGKTTCAKILAQAINCEHPVNGEPCRKCPSCQAIESGTAQDVLEMDAASNNSVDDVRDLKDEINYPPAELRKKVYIIDEVHMLSKSAFNAILKTLEEPPEYVVFILATTDPQKLLSTIVSRCQRFDFQRIPTDKLSARLKYIAEKEQFQLEEDASVLISRQAQGGMRDAISMLELCSSTDKHVTAEVVNRAVGLMGRNMTIQTVKAIHDNNYSELFRLVDGAVRGTGSPNSIWNELLSFYRDLLVLKVMGEEGKTYLDLTDSEMADMMNLVSAFSQETLLYHCRLMEKNYVTAQGAYANARLSLEMTLIQMCDPALDQSYEALAKRVSDLENGAVRISAQPMQSTPDAKPQPKKTEPAPKQEAKPVADTPAPEKKENTGKRIRNWSEVCEKMSEMYRSFLTDAHAVAFDDGRVVIYLQNAIGKIILQNPDAKDNLRMALERNLQRAIPEEKIFYETGADELPPDDMDDIMEEIK